jgi:hypothetical protein
MKSELKNNISAGSAKSKRVKSKRSAKLGSAPNMQAAANRTSYPFEMLSEAKNLGCRAFTLRGSVDCDAFIEWLQAPEQKDFREKWEKEGVIPTRETSKRIKDHYDAMEAKRKHEEKLHKLILRTEFAAKVASVGEKQRAILEPHVAPTVLAEICAAMQPLFDELMEAK